MLALDATTRAEYDAESTASAAAQAVIDALADPVTVRIYDGAGAVKGSGTMATPWATQSAGVITVAELSSFTVSAAGTPDGTWYLRFESGSAWVRGTFGHEGADFSWSLPTWAAGQSGRIGTIVLNATDAGLVTGSGAITLGELTIAGTGTASNGLPAWIAELDVGEWASVPTSNSIGDVAYGTSPGGTVGNIVNAWGGIAVSASGDVYFFGGGHADYAGNEIYKLALNQASPVYSRINDPTTSVRTNENYYADGKPTSRHTYQTLTVRGTELVCTGGAGLWGTGSVDPQYTDVFDLETETWSTQVADGDPGPSCINWDTGVIYNVTPNGGYWSFRYLSTGNSWTTLGNGALDPWSSWSALCFDSARGRIYSIGNTDQLDVHYWEIGTGGANPALSGTAASQFDNAGQYTGVDYDVQNDVILKKDASGATVYQMDCADFACTEYSTTGATPGDATNGVNGRFKYIPDLKGFIYVPSWGNAYFLKTGT